MVFVILSALEFSTLGLVGFVLPDVNCSRYFQFAQQSLNLPPYCDKTTPAPKIQNVRRMENVLYFVIEKIRFYHSTVQFKTMCTSRSRAASVILEGIRTD